MALHQTAASARHIGPAPAPWAQDPAVSRRADVLVLGPRPDDPPSFFTCPADREVQLRLASGFGYDPAGARPDLLRPAL
ncbi:hypothetical protein [Streptomyces sp. NPDC048332]|uniref:hypothetical protein n=1 Tax=Streptomyces sp. NPDC048332 TaxID=3154619 RepID=UPI00341CDF95